MRFTLLAVWLICCSNLLAQRPQLQPMMSSMPPYQYEDDQGIQGLVWQLWQQLLAHADMESEQPFLLPWARALLMADQQENAVLFTTVRTPERESVFQWLGPIVPSGQ